MKVLDTKLNFEPTLPGRLYEIFIIVVILYFVNSKLSQRFGKPQRSKVEISARIQKKKEKIQNVGSACL